MTIVLRRWPFFLRSNSCISNYDTVPKTPVFALCATFIVKAGGWVISNWAGIFYTSTSRQPPSFCGSRGAFHTQFHLFWSAIDPLPCLVWTWNNCIRSMITTFAMADIFVKGKSTLAPRQVSQLWVSFGCCLHFTSGPGSCLCFH